MTFNVFGGTLNLALSIYLYIHTWVVSLPARWHRTVGARSDNLPRSHSVAMSRCQYDDATAAATAEIADAAAYSYSVPVWEWPGIKSSRWWIAVKSTTAAPAVMCSKMLRHNFGRNAEHLQTAGWQRRYAEEESDRAANFDPLMPHFVNVAANASTRIYIFILFHQTVVAKKTQTHTYTYTHTYKYTNIYVHTQIIYTHIRPYTWRQLNCMTWQTHYFIH